jgi:hypothetical protein
MSVNTQNLQMEIEELGELAPINQKLRLEELIQRIAKDNARAAEVAKSYVAKFPQNQRPAIHVINDYAHVSCWHDFVKTSHTHFE